MTQENKMQQLIEMLFSGKYLGQAIVDFDTGEIRLPLEMAKDWYLSNKPASQNDISLGINIHNREEPNKVLSCLASAKADLDGAEFLKRVIDLEDGVYRSKHDIKYGLKYFAKILSASDFAVLSELIDGQAFFHKRNDPRYFVCAEIYFTHEGMGLGRIRTSDDNQ